MQKSTAVLTAALMFAIGIKGFIFSPVKYGIGNNSGKIIKKE